MIVKVPRLINLFYSSLVWIKNSNKLFLTFDDGPNADITAKILDILDKYNVKATFFCVGDNVKKYPEIYSEIIKRGHLTGNHTFNHLNGWKTEDDEYFQNVKKAGELIGSHLFRPPYGRIKRKQIKRLKQEFDIIMWTVLTYDFINKITPEMCYNNSLKGLTPGSIIVFHDNVKARENLFYALPKFLDTAIKNGFEFGLFE